MSGIQQMFFSKVGISASNFIGYLATPYSVHGYSITVDSSGNIYVCGRNDSYNAIEVVKYNNRGALQWQKRLGTTNQNYGKGICVDTSGNVYVCGYTYLNPYGYLVVAKYDSSGTLQWQRQLGATSYETDGAAIHIDTSGSVYVCGSTNRSGTYDFVVAKYDSSGVLQSKQFLGDNQDNRGLGITLDSSNNIYVCGSTNATSMQICKLNSSFSIQWQNGISNVFDGAKSIRVASSGNVYVCGRGWNDPTNYMSLAKLNSTGVVQWEKYLNNTYTAGSVSTANSVAVDTNENIYVCGSTAIPGDIMVIVKYNSSGVIQWQRFLSFGGTLYGNSISVDSNNFYVTGDGNQGLVTASLPLDGSKTGTYTVGSFSVTYSAGYLTAPSRTPSVTGTALVVSAATTLTDSASSLSSNNSSYTPQVTTL